METAKTTLRPMEWPEYEQLVRKLLPGRASAGTEPGDLLGYWRGHSPRFRVLTEMMRANLEKAPVHTVLDAGTEFPFASLYMNALTGAWVVCAGMGNGQPVGPFAWATGLNLCRRPELVRPVADLTICTEVLEHLPCNVYDVLDWLRASARSYLLLSFPLGGQGARDYDKHWPQNYDVLHKKHLREFTPATAKDMLDRIGWPILDMRDSHQPAYGAPIRNVLLRRPQ